MTDLTKQSLAEGATAELLERLEALDIRPWTYSLHTPDRPPITPFNPDGPEAATIIRQLQSELAALKKAGTFNEGVEAMPEWSEFIIGRHAFAGRGEAYAYAKGVLIYKSVYDSIRAALSRPTTQPEKDESR